MCRFWGKLSMTTWNGLLEMCLIVGSFVVITVIVSICYCWFYKGHHSPLSRNGQARDLSATTFTEVLQSTPATTPRRPLHSDVQPGAAVTTPGRPVHRSEYHMLPCIIDCKSLSLPSSVAPTAPDFPGDDDTTIASTSLGLLSPTPQPQLPVSELSISRPLTSSSLPPPAYSELFPGRK